MVLASTNKQGIPSDLRAGTHSEEETYPGELSFEHDIQIIFTKQDQIEEVQALVNQHHLNHIKVDSLDNLNAAAELEQELGSYFYDIYNSKKW